MVKKDIGSGPKTMITSPANQLALREKQRERVVQGKWHIIPNTKNFSLGKHWPLLPPLAKNPAKLLQFWIFLLLEDRVSDPDPDPFGYAKFT